MEDLKQLSIRKRVLSLNRESERQRYLAVLATRLWNMLAREDLALEEELQIIRELRLIFVGHYDLSIDEIRKDIEALKEGK